MTKHSEKPKLPYGWAAAMRDKLHKNRHKGTRKDWQCNIPRSLLRRVREELDELERAVRLGDAAGARDEAADVANMAMMVADAVRYCVIIGEHPWKTTRR